MPNIKKYDIINMYPKEREGIKMGVEYRKINLQEIGIADIYSICNDAIKNDPDIYNKNGKAKLKYLGLLKALKDLNIPVSQLPNSMDEQEIKKVEQEIKRGITEEELQSFTTILEKMLKNLEN